MEVLSFYGKGVASNTFLLINGSDAVIIDASCFDPIVKTCRERNLCVRAILLTHGHFDHTLYLSKLKDEFNAPIYIHKNDANMLSDGYLSAYNLFFNNFSYDKRPPADELIIDDRDLDFGSISLKAKNLPGHTSGSTVYQAHNLLFTGDVLFATSIGRCDLPSSDQRQMVDSLKYFNQLPRDYKIFSGHGPNCDLNYVFKYNFYFNNP